MRPNIILFGDNHHGLASTYGNMGIIFKDKGELDKALEYQEKSREIMIKNLGFQSGGSKTVIMIKIQDFNPADRKR